MIKHMDGFDQFEGQTKMIDALALAGYEASGNTSLVGGRNQKTRALQIEGTLKRTFSSNENKVVLGFAYFASEERSNIVTIKDLLTLEWPGAIRIGSVIGEAKPIIGVWYYYEIVVDKSSKEISVYINNELDLVTTMPDSATFMRDFEVKFEAGSSAKQIDDLVFIDSASGGAKDRVGPLAIGIRLPRADVVSDFSVPNENYHFANVNVLPPVDGTYIKSNVSKASDTFMSSDEVGEGTPVAVGMIVMAKKSDIDGRQLGMIVGDAKADKVKEVIDTDLSTTNKFSYAIFETDPDGNPWTAQSIQSTPFGVRVRP